jgi:hypothetical protein
MDYEDLKIGTVGCIPWYDLIRRCVVVEAIATLHIVVVSTIRLYLNVRFT